MQFAVDNAISISFGYANASPPPKDARQLVLILQKLVGLGRANCFPSMLRPLVILEYEERHDGTGPNRQNYSEPD